MKLGPMLITLAILLASLSVASAQEPPSLRTAPDAGAAAQESRDVAGRWLGATDAAVQSFAKAGGSLTSIVTGKFDGLSKSIAVADYAAPLSAASAGDVRGTVSGAAAIAVGGKVTAGGAVLFGEVGTIAGGAVGSFFPVIGNIAGSIVGGAIGTAAGGFICAFGYDKYLKDYVAKGVTGIVSVFDTAPLSEAMQAKRAFLWATMSPEQQAQLHTFKPEEVQLLDFATLPYVVVPKQPLPGVPAPDAQQQATLGDELPTSFVLNQNAELNQPVICKVSSGAVVCAGQHTIATGQVTYSLSGTVNGNTLNVQSRSLLLVRADKCNETVEYLGHEQIVLQSDGRASTNGSFNMRVLARSGYCGSPTSLTGSHSLVGTWKAEIK